MPQVEVNELNIAVFELVQLTGNTKEELLVAAREAEASGHVLYCQIPDEEGHINVFKHGRGVPPSEQPEQITVEQVESEYKALPSPEVDFRIVDVVDAEVVEDEDA